MVLIIIIGGAICTHAIWRIQKKVEAAGDEEAICSVLRRFNIGSEKMGILLQTRWQRLTSVSLNVDVRIWLQTGVSRV